MVRVLGSEAVASKMFKAEVVLEKKGVGEAWYESNFVVILFTLFSNQPRMTIIKLFYFLIFLRQTVFETIIIMYLVFFPLDMVYMQRI